MNGYSAPRETVEPGGRHISMAGAEGARVAWVDYAKGICLVAVVSLYATYYVQDAQGGKGWMLYWVNFAAPFRMPDFFLLAGLFLAKTIAQPWKKYIDRKVFHFLYFFMVWTTIYFVLHEIQDKSAADQPAWWREYLTWYIDPFHMLWFIELLPVFYVVTRLVHRLPWPLVLAVASVLQMLEIDTDFAQFDRFCERYVYFYAGYALAPVAFRLAAWAARRPAGSMAILIAWAATNEALVLADLSQQPGIGLVLGFAGAGAVIMVGSLLSRFRWMWWLRYLGQNSIVVFLSFFLATAATARALISLDIVEDIGTQQVIVIAVSVVVPFVLRRLVRGTPGRFLFERPQWARFYGATAPALPKTASRERSVHEAHAL